MNKTDYLYHDQMITKCNSAITLLNQDIADNLALKRKLNSIIKDGKLKGQSIAALKDNLRDYFICIGLILSADKSDKNDLERLKSKLASQTDYNGPLIWKHFEEARAKMNTAEATASDFRIKERSYSPPWYYDEELDKWLQSDDPNPYTSKVRHYEDIADTERKIMEAAQRKMKEFDSFATDTMGYLSAGKEIRKTVSETFTLMKTQKEGGIYSPGVAKVYLNKLLLSDNSYLNKIANDIIGSEEYGDYLIDSKYYDDKKELELINSQINTYYNMINSGNTAASEAAKKNMNIDNLLQRRSQIIESIFSKMEHSEEFLNAFEFAKIRNYSSDKLDELMWYWATIDDMDVSKCSAVPESWIKEIKHDYSMTKWIVTDNPIMSYYYFESVLDNYFIKSFVDGNGKELFLNEKIIKTVYPALWYESIFKDYVSEESDNNILTIKKESLKDLVNNLTNMGEEIISDKDLLNKFMLGLGSEALQFVWLSGLMAETIQPAPLGFCPDLNKHNSSAYISNIIDTQKTANVLWGEFGKRLMKDVVGLPGEKINALYTQLSQIPILNTLSKGKIDAQYESNICAFDDYKKVIKKLQTDFPQNPYYKNPYDDGKFYIEYQHGFGNELLYGKYIPGLSNIFMTYKTEDGEKINYFEIGKGLYGAHNTCEVISVYNVMTFLEDEEVDFAQIVKDFDSKAPAVAGNWGTAPDYVEEYLKIQGYKTDTIDVNNLYYNPNGKDDFDDLLENYDAFIISDWNTTYADDAMHTMAITVKKGINEMSEPTYEIVLHNDSGGCHYTKVESSDEFYNLICGYTKEKINDKYFPVYDGAIKIIGVEK